MYGEIYDRYGGGINRNRCVKGEANRKERRCRENHERRHTGMMNKVLGKIRIFIDI